jgi:inorganic pyrophosphatase
LAGFDQSYPQKQSYPAKGFIKGTLVADGDLVDALVLAGDPTFPAPAFVRGAGRSASSARSVRKGLDEKLVCVSVRDPQRSQAHDIADLAASFPDEINFSQV